MGWGKEEEQFEKRPSPEKNPYTKEIPLANLTDERNKAFASFPRAKFSKPATLRTPGLSTQQAPPPPHSPSTTFEDVRSSYKAHHGWRMRCTTANEWRRDVGCEGGIMRGAARLRVLIRSRSFDTYQPYIPSPTLSHVIPSYDSGNYAPDRMYLFA